LTILDRGIHLFVSYAVNLYKPFRKSEPNIMIVHQIYSNLLFYVLYSLNYSRGGIGILIHILKSIFVISSFLLISTQTSISQPVDFDFMFGWGVDTGASEFQICTSSCQAGIRGSGDGQFFQPFGIAVDAMKNIYVADSTNNARIQVFSEPPPPPPPTIPTLSEWGLIALAVVLGIVGIVGFMVIRRRKVTV
jgi:hypothetical protein